jgi:hypothetical protein
MSPGLPGRFGPFHRRSESKPHENDLICSSGQLWGRARRNFYAGLIPAVKAWSGPLPANAVGIEFYCNVEPDRGSVPGEPEWTGPRPGVIVIEVDEVVAIEVTVTQRRDAE